MFQKSLHIVKNGEILFTLNIFPIFDKISLFLPNDRLMLFGASTLKTDFAAPKKSQVFLNNELLGVINASGSVDVRTDHFTGLLHLMYIS